MDAENFSYAQAKERLDSLVVEVRKKDISLEKSLDLLEEGVRLANQCTELIDQADWDALLPSEEEAKAANAQEQDEDDIELEEVALEDIEQDAQDSE